MKKVNAPRLYSTVYVIVMCKNRISIEPAKVEFKNTYGFAHDVENDIKWGIYKVCYYDGYGSEWFYTLKEAKEYIERTFHKTPKKFYDDFTKEPFWLIEL